MSDQPVWEMRIRLPPCPRYPYYVPNRLWAQSPLTAKRVTLLPRHLKSNRHNEGRPFNLADAEDRARAYAALLVFGTPDQQWQYLDGELLLSVWPEMLLPWKDIRPAWQPLIDAYREKNN